MPGPFDAAGSGEHGVGPHAEGLAFYPVRESSDRGFSAWSPSMGALGLRWAHEWTPEAFHGFYFTHESYRG